MSLSCLIDAIMDRRLEIIKAFEEFQRHRADQFWIDRVVQVSTEVAAKRAGIVVQEAGVKQIQISFDQYIVASPPQSLADDSAARSETNSKTIEAEIDDEASPNNG
ncbi:hypothetical protein BGZ95_001996 [Linnemannia exigua]|uniref:Uncharacterized protein n=1 Tax=Linnemannia exigua TaxID=604196 RepID=A0AAD4H3P1_9FUNG|nr:hypothetical protein BGZ95_001996 [Linnemannia exigua]